MKKSILSTLVTLFLLNFTMLTCTAKDVQIHAQLLQHDEIISEVTFNVKDRAQGDASLGNLVSDRITGSYVVFTPEIQGNGQILLRTSAQYDLLKGEDENGPHLENLRTRDRSLFSSGQPKTYIFEDENGHTYGLKMIITPKII